MIANIWAALSGWKTHAATTIPALVLAALVVAEKYAGVDIPGFEVPDGWVALVLGGLGFGALRDAVAKK